MKPDLNRYEDRWTAEIYDFEQARDWGDRDVPFYLGLAAEFPGPVLELGCGTGRVTLLLARSGAEVTGLDISPHMLTVARRKLAAEEPAVQSRVQFVPGDMCAFDLGKQFRLIAIPFRAFQALLTRDEHRGCLRCCRDHLLPDGRLAIDVFNPRLSRLVEGQAQGQLLEGPDEFPGPAGAKVTWSAVTSFDLRDQRLHGNWRYECLSAAAEKTVSEHVLEMHYFFRFDIEWMLEACGFEVEALYGNFDRGEFTAESPEMIFVARRVR